MFMHRDGRTRLDHCHGKSPHYSHHSSLPRTHHSLSNIHLHMDHWCIVLLSYNIRFGTGCLHTKKWGRIRHAKRRFGDCSNRLFVHTCRLAGIVRNYKTDPVNCNRSFDGMLDMWWYAPKRSFRCLHRTDTRPRSPRLFRHRDTSSSRDGHHSLLHDM